MILAAVGLLLVALAFVAAELFVPSHGLLAIFAALAAVASVTFAYKANLGLGLVFTLVIFIAAPVVLFWAVRLYPKTSMGKKVMLEQPGTGEAFLDQSAKLAALVGQAGVAVTLLRPAGSVEVLGQRIDALSEADVIEPGTPIEVVRVNGLKVFVKAAATTT